MRFCASHPPPFRARVHMATKPLLIRGLSTISPLGSSPQEISQSLSLGIARADRTASGPVFRLSEDGCAHLAHVQGEHRYSHLDRTALLAIACARQTFARASHSAPPVGCVSIGSTRGATTTIENTIERFSSGASALPPSTSLTTTAGNISSWVAQEAADRGDTTGRIAAITTSMTCTSAFHSLLVCYAFVRAGLANTALFGGAESCLTPYTMAQLHALRIYSKNGGEFPCMPCLKHDQPVNTVTLGEGAGTAMLMEDDGTAVEGDITLLGLGWATEKTPSATGISEDGEAFQVAMRAALEQLPPGRLIDAVVLHAPGTTKGDAAELAAVREVLGSVPLCSTKHLTGHTYGASGMMSLSMAAWLLDGGDWQGFPYPCLAQSSRISSPQTVLINTAGFGGNAVALIVGRG